jgi:hypothetical protein
MCEEQQGKKMEQEGAEAAEGVFVVSVWCEGRNESKSGLRRIFAPPTLRRWRTAIPPESNPEGGSEAMAMLVPSLEQLAPIPSENPAIPAYSR